MILWYIRANASLQMNVPNCLVSYSYAYAWSNETRLLFIPVMLCKMQLLAAFNKSFHMFLDHTECPIEGQVFSECKGCDGTCEQPLVPCPKICLPGCSCPVGTVVHEGKCVPLEDCPPPGECCSDTRSKATRL